MSASRCDKPFGSSTESPLDCAQLRRAVDAAGIGLWRWDGEQQEVTLDARSCEVHGVSSDAGSIRSWTQFLESVHPEDHAGLQRAWNETSQDGDFRDLEYRCVLPDGEIRWVSCSGSFAGGEVRHGATVFGTCFDVTARKLVHEQLMLAQKMEAVGQLTSGIAHNFNNILSAILPNLQMASRHMNPGGEKYLRSANIAAERAGDLVAELMVVAGRKEAQRVRALDLSEVIDRVVRICKTTFGGWVQLVFEVDSPSTTILGNEGQIEQVLLNLLLNARDAFETSATSCPRIIVELETGDTDPSDAALVLRVTDNGPGMAEGVLGRIFEPFFTTKGTGTGLGLATAYAIVTEHKGTISCVSNPEQGTEFEVVLPLYAGVAEVKAKPAISTFVGGTETILVVDDDALVRRVTSAALRDAGYEVFEAPGGNEAIAAQVNQDNFDLVVLDMSMPELAGDQVLAAMRGRDPQIKVLIFTGLADARVTRLEDVDVLQKPAGVNDLLQAVRLAIDTQTIN